LKCLVLDEIYTFIGSKQKRWYIWTAWAQGPRSERYAWYYVSETKDTEALQIFLKHLPRAEKYFTDGNQTYSGWLGPQVVVGKGAMTNLIESINSQIRQYVSRLHRKTKAYAKSARALEESLALAFISKIIQ
jgi:IS1 family transposase